MLMTTKRALRRLMTLGVALAVLSGCGEGDGGLAASLRLSEMSESEEQTFCQWATEDTVCAETAGNPDDETEAGFTAPSSESGETPVEICLDSLDVLPDCTVGEYEPCLDEAKRDPCGAADASDCQALASCPQRPPSGRGAMSRDAAALACGLEIGTGIGALVWEMRRRIDDFWYCGGDVVSYCIEYSMACDHWSWEEYCVCAKTDCCH